MGFAFILYLIVLAIIFYIDYLIAKKCEQIAADKGYTDYKIFAWTFWLTPIGIAMTIALPDKKSQEYQKKMIELMEETKDPDIRQKEAIDEALKF